MVMIKVVGTDEERVVGNAEMLEPMDEYNDKLTKAGILLDAAGLRPSAEAKQVVFEGGTTSVVDGPFTEAKEIVAGYWIWEVGTVEEALEWARQCPVDPTVGRGRLEIRPYFDEADVQALRD
ncbi:YciI family protein [Asanoa sp. NPDC049573]|uniref:YciI family protein n=1 Tax=Asanoa sp. NPDC049573 TaxID=3155396 RepID=UPI0034205EEC